MYVVTNGITIFPESGELANLPRKTVGKPYKTDDPLRAILKFMTWDDEPKWDWVAIDLDKSI